MKPARPLDLPPATPEQWEAAFRKTEATFARNKSRRHVLACFADALRREAVEHQCETCGLRYADGAHHYDDTCNPCARKHGLDVPR